nr:zinc finger protein 774-like [Nerophis lumbriciformis]
MLKELVQERLMAAADEIFALVERTIACYEEELSRTREEKERHRRQLEAVLHIEDVQLMVARGEFPPQLLGSISALKQEDSQPPHIKEEEEELWITQEGECLPGADEADPAKLPLSGFSVKTEDDEDKPPESSPLHHSPSEENGGAELSSGSWPQHPTRDADHCEGLLSGGDDTRLEVGDWDGEALSSEGDTRMQRSERSKRKTGKKRFPCSVCDKMFTQKCDFTRHMRTHTGEKPYCCLVCGARFAQRSTLTRHMKTHTGEKPFSCSVCGEKFSLKVNMLSHLRTHTGEKPFICSVCGEGFSRKMHVVLHMRTHTGEKPFRCSVCGDAFAQSSTLNRHMGTHKMCSVNHGEASGGSSDTCVD